MKSQKRTRNIGNKSDTNELILKWNIKSKVPHDDERRDEGG